jgi:glycosyltransferase involved in cell wall biosynthesis
MRILIATPHATIVGGVETYLRALLPALARRGHELALLYEAPCANGAARLDNRVPAWRLGESGALEAAGAWDPDVCYLHGLESPDAEAALLARFPVVLFAHNYHGTCVSGAKSHARPSPCPCDHARGTACLLRYYPRRCGGLNPLTLLRQYHLQARRAALLGRYRAVVVGSRHMRREYLRHGVLADRLHLVPLFPPGDVPDPEPPCRRQPTRRVLLAGRLTSLKGGAVLIDALRRASDERGHSLTLVVAGDGPEKARLALEAKSRGVTAEFHGWVDANTRRALMRGADVLAVPSVWPEPFGLVGLEAGCVGLPAVGFAVGGIPDWLLPGESGELAPGDPPTVAGLTAALVRALRDPDYLTRLRVGAWLVAQRFTRDSHLDHLERVLGADAVAPVGKWA